MLVQSHHSSCETELGRVTSQKILVTSHHTTQSNATHTAQAAMGVSSSSPQSSGASTGNVFTTHQQKESSSSPPPLPRLLHGCMLQGLPQSGRSTVQSTLELKDSRVFTLDPRFLTTPQIYTTRHIDHVNEPYVALRARLPYQKSKDVVDMTYWQYGGRGGVWPRWKAIARNTRAIIFTVDATRRDRLQPPAGYESLKEEFVAGYASKTKQEQQEILSTLTSDKHLFVTGMLEHLLNEVDQYTPLPLLVLVTHADCDGAMSVEEVCDALKLHDMTNCRDWRISACNAKTGEGLHDAMDWLNMTVATPTDWNLNKSQAHNVKRLQPDREKAIQGLRRVAEVKAAEVKERDERLKRGDIVKAPLLYKTNGELWTVTEEQLATFVVAPLTPVIIAEEPHEAVGMEIKKDKMEEHELHVNEAQEAAGDHRDRSDSTASTASSSSFSSVTPPSDSSSSSDSEDQVSHLAVTRTHTPESTSSTKEDIRIKTFPSSIHNKLASSYLQSTTFPLLPSSFIPTARLVLRKKHFFSREKTMQPDEDQGRNIHKGYAMRYY